MIFFIIFIIVIVVFILIGMVKIKLDINFDEGKDSCCLLRILCFKFKLFPYSEKKKPKNKNIETSSAKKEKNSKDASKGNNKKGDKKKRSFSDILDMVKICLNPLPKSLNFLKKGIKIKNLNVTWCIATDDAFETALQYGRCCSCFYAVLGALGSIFNLQIGTIKIYPDFKNENPSCAVSLRIQVSIGRIFLTTLHYLIIITIKLLSKNKKESAK